MNANRHYKCSGRPLHYVSITFHEAFVKAWLTDRQKDWQTNERKWHFLDLRGRLYKTRVKPHQSTPLSQCWFKTILVPSQRSYLKTESPVWRARHLLWRVRLFSPFPPSWPCSWVSFELVSFLFSYRRLRVSTKRSSLRAFGPNATLRGADDIRGLADRETIPKPPFETSSRRWIASGRVAWPLCLERRRILGNWYFFANWY